MSKNSGKHDIKTLGLAEPCIWFNGGDLNHPFPGICVGSNDRGMLDIYLVPTSGGDNKPAKKGVPHKNDPRLEEDPPYRRAVGCWCTVAEHKAMVRKATDDARKLSESRAEEEQRHLEETVARLNEEGHTADQIAHAVDVAPERILEMVGG